MRPSTSFPPQPSQWRRICQWMNGHPISSLTICYVLWKSLLLLALLSSPGPGYDTSATLIPFQASGRDGTFFSTLSHRLLKLVRWDTIYFLRIAERGYLYEQEWAFGYGYTLSWFASDTYGPLELALVGVTLSHVCHYLSVLSLFGLSKIVFQEKEANARRVLPFLSAILHIISPAGAFLSAAYGEPVFSFLNFTGFYVYISALDNGCKGANLSRDVKLVLAGALFATATTVRSNGILSGILFAYDAIISLADIYRKGLSFVAVRRLASIGLGGSLILLAIVVPQYVAFRQYCQNVVSPRPWCDQMIPSIYAWVQKEYWNVGFLRYWTISNVPLFLLAAPMILLLCVSSFWALKGPVAAKAKGKESGGKGEGRETNFQQACLCRLAIPQAVLAVLALTNYHVQIINRISSGYPVWYWFLAVHILEDKKVRGVFDPQMLVFVMVLYGFIQGALFSSFLPPA